MQQNPANIETLCPIKQELERRPALEGSDQVSTCFLGDPNCPAKPRKTGLTSIIDPGLPVAAFADLIQSHHLWIDSVKFGWATALVTPRLDQKIAVLERYAIPFWFGGTLFERAYAERRLADFVAFVSEHRAPYVEISDGTINLPAPEKLKLIRQLSHDFLVLSEIGKKAGEIEPEPGVWCRAIWTELEAGARWVVLEGREGGNAGLYEPSGTPRLSLIEEILKTSLSLNDLVFEAPQKHQQAFFINRIGPDVNLANIAAGDVIGLETLRRGLRSDTFGRFSQTPGSPSIKRSLP